MSRQAVVDSTGIVEAPRKRRIFMWFFLAVQAIFIIWLVTGIAGSSGHASNCGSLSQQSCDTAKNVGAGLGVAFIGIFWIAVDFLLALAYGVYRLAKRA